MELRKISAAAIPAALAKADKYRLLNEPWQAESICRDVLAVDESNQTALITLLLALTDQLDGRAAQGVRAAEEIGAKISDEYQRVYYSGLICERWARALLATGTQQRHQAFDWLHEAMSRYEKAEKLHTDGNDDPILRWNACARTIAQEKLEPSPEHIDRGD
jgi:hypothetical protein